MRRAASGKLAITARCPSRTFAKVALLRPLPVGQNIWMGQSIITRLRKARHLTIEKLAEESGLSLSFMSRVESGARDLSNASRPRVAKALGVSPAELIKTCPPSDDGRNELPASDVAANDGGENSIINSSGETMDRVTVGVLKVLLTCYNYTDLTKELGRIDDQMKAEKKRLP